MPSRPCTPSLVKAPLLRREDADVEQQQKWIRRPSPCATPPKKKKKKTPLVRSIRPVEITPLWGGRELLKSTLFALHRASSRFWGHSAAQTSGADQRDHFPLKPTRDRMPPLIRRPHGRGLPSAVSNANGLFQSLDQSGPSSQEPPCCGSEAS